MRVRVVTPRELGNSEWARWRDIQQNERALASPYFSAGFTQAVGQWRDDSRVALIEEGHVIQAFFPYQLWPERVARPIGGPVSDNHGLVAAQGRCWGAKELLAACGLCAYDFDHLPAEQSTFAPYVRSTRSDFLVDLRRGYAAYTEERRAAGSQLVRKVRAKRRKMSAEIGPERFVPDDRSEEAFETVLTWKRAQYRRTGAPDIFERPWIAGLVRQIFGTRDAAFAGVLSTLYAGTRLVAGHIGMRSGPIWHHWFPAYDEGFARFSPGDSLLLHMCEAAPSLGIETIEMGPGTPEYKSRFATSTVPLGTGFVEVTSAVALFRAAQRAVDRALGSLPLGPVATWPGRALRKIEYLRALR